jgi:hypothetical protein
LYDPRNKKEENKRGYVDINNREYVRVQNEYYDDPGTRTITTSRYDPSLDGPDVRVVRRTVDNGGQPEVVRVSFTIILFHLENYHNKRTLILRRCYFELSFKVWNASIKFYTHFKLNLFSLFFFREKMIYFRV